MTDFKSRYRVDNVPWYWWLPFQFYGWVVGIVAFLYSNLVAVTSQVTYTGYPIDPNKNYIFCFWHQKVFAYHCLVSRFDKLSFFVHPVWYMKPTHVTARLMGANNLVLGSSGNRGREAAAQLVTYLREGDSTFFTPDGPYGPAGLVQKGALHIAMQSQTPVAPIRITPSRYFSLKGWDKKQIPLPFSSIVVEVAEPFIPDDTNLDDAVKRLAVDMTG